MEYSKQRAKEMLESTGTLRNLTVPDPDMMGLSAAEAVRVARKVAFIRAFCVRGLVLDGTVAAGVSRSTVENWRASDEWFEELYGAAILEACDSLEAEAHRRAVEGVDEVVTFQGMPTTLTDPATGEQRMFTVKKYSDNLLALLLKAHNPDRFRENVKTTHNFEGTTGVLVVPSAIDPDTWAKAAAEQQAQYAGNQGEDR